jgi:hypothetical protein
MYNTTTNEFTYSNAIAIAGTATVANLVTTSGVFWANGVNALSPSYGNTQMLANLSATGNPITIGSNLTVGGVTNFGNNLLVGNNAVFVGNSTVGGLTIGTGTQFGLNNTSYGVIWPASVTPSTYNYSMLIGSGDVQINATRVTLQGSGSNNFRVQSGTASSTSATSQGTQVIQQGLGVTGDSYFSANLGIGGNLTANVAGTTTTVANLITTSGLFWANGAAYSSGSGAKSTSATTPPSSPAVGDIWYNTTTDDIYRWTTDGVSSYWLDITGATVANVPANLVGTTLTTSGNITVGGSLYVTSNVVAGTTTRVEYNIPHPFMLMGT